MTLIAFATYGDHAQFITDTASYTDRVTKMGTCTKHITVNHLDAAVLVQGDAMFGDAVFSAAVQVGAQVATFDEMTDTAPSWLHEMWAASQIERGTEPVDSTAFLLGYSARDGEFVAYGFASEDNFEPRRLEGTFVTPSPWAARPSEIELGRFATYCEGRDDRDELVRVWSSREPWPTPEGLEDWYRLAMEVRHSRALQSFAHVIVAGRVMHTVLGRGVVHTQAIHQFDDHGEEFLKLVEPTDHPLAQAARVSQPAAS